ncbi:ArsR/SmtB family transcription factor [Kurthia gibsonii]|uniref:ArsR/SmtB family transcription factor n=1 Tax=Kurthia gibsonii TaxID=33946 RepID=UPI0011441FDD|nr:metalloregulator ArsR/SmtB family transcription factor [Kurthia gibsonii]GED20854.1 HTH-type transcriptional repressor AseR [Kurthia gibsonii]
MLNANIEMNTASEIFKLLGHETRLTMLKILDDHDCCVCEFVEIFQATQPSISQHIRKLKDSGLIKEERRGQWIFYSTNEENVHYHFIIQLLNLLPNQNEKLKELEDSGTRIKCE